MTAVATRKRSRKKPDADELIAQWRDHPGGMISLLQAIQAAYGYLPEDVLRRVSERTNTPLSTIYSLATFYARFTLKPRGKYEIRVCVGTGCHVRGAKKVLDAFRRELGIEPGNTTDDGMFSLECVACLGGCAMGPVVSVGEKIYGQMTPAKVPDLLESLKGGRRK